MSAEGETVGRVMASDQGAPGVEDPAHAHERSCTETGRSRSWPSPAALVRMANAEGNTAIMNGSGKSDDSIVPVKPANEGTQPSQDGHLPEELAEGRESTEGNVCQPTADGMQGPRPASRGAPRSSRCWRSATVPAT